MGDARLSGTTFTGLPRPARYLAAVVGLAVLGVLAVAVWPVALATIVVWACRSDVKAAKAAKQGRKP